MRSGLNGNKQLKKIERYIQLFSMRIANLLEAF